MFKLYLKVKNLIIIYDNNTVYPIGVPSVFAYLLYHAKDDIIHRTDHLGGIKENGEKRFHLAAIRSLYDAYSPEYWYW